LDTSRTVSPPSVAEAPTGVAVAIEGLTVTYGQRLALDGISLEVAKGAIFGLLGPNGSGKTTLLSALLGLLTPFAGTLTIFGSRPGPWSRHHIGTLFQESCLDPLMTVEETLQLQGRLFAIGKAERKARIRSLLGEFDLWERRSDLTRTLSGGLKRRLELARALLVEPRLLLLDEPAAGLDPETRLALWSHLLRLKAQGVTLIVATHDMAEADRLCDRVGFLVNGRLAAEGMPADLKLDLKRDSVHLEWPELEDFVLEEIATLPGVGRMTWARPVLHVTVDRAASFVPKLFELGHNGIQGIRIRESTLEDAYFQVAGSGSHND